MTFANHHAEPVMLRKGTSFKIAPGEGEIQTQRGFGAFSPGKLLSVYWLCARMGMALGRRNRSKERFLGRVSKCLTDS